ncbi:hypothetical protein [Bradyrhizobium sp. McL0615]|uniref:hypothetical protein n=1 Tax=Bradyrhizobium sp. McL0615 TaxID=3415673 RepID=UPI003CE86F2D
MFRLFGDRDGLSPHLREKWGYVRFHHLILATDDFIVFLDNSLDVDWKSSPGWDEAHRNQRRQLDEILNRAAQLEAGDWDRSDVERTLSLKRQIGEAIARGLGGNIAQAKQMLDTAEEYRDNAILDFKRSRAIRGQVKIKDEWESYYKRWTAIHYTIGIGAVILSTLVASKPTWIGSALGSGEWLGIFAWLAAVFTGLLTFLSPEKKASKYSRAWSSLNSEITRYNADESYTVNDVLEAYNKGQNVIFETSDTGRRR